MKKKDTLKRITCWIGVIAVLIFTLFTAGYAGQTTFALTVGESQSNIATAAQIQAVAKTFKKCVEYENSRGSGSYNYKTGSDAISNLFGPTAGAFSHKTVSVGAGVEQLVQGKVDDGDIWCDNAQSNIARIFIHDLGVDYATLFCNGDQPGLLRTLTEGESCSQVLDNPDFSLYWSRDTALDQLKRIYNDYLNKRPEIAVYLPKWDDIDTVSSPELKYYMYLRDFKAGCIDANAEVYDSSQSNSMPSTYYATIKELDTNTGEVTEKNYRKKSGTSSSESWSGTLTGEKGAGSCDNLVNLINTYAEPAFKKVEGANTDASNAATEAKKKECNSNLSSRAARVKARARDLINQSKSNPGSVPANMLNAAEQALRDIDDRNGQYWEERNGEIVCITPSSFNTIDPDGSGSNGFDNPDSNTNNGAQAGEDGSYDNVGADQFNVDSCYDAADSLGWILCPVIKGLAAAADGIYEWLIEPFLNADTSSEGLKSGWDAVRNVANIGFAIMFAIVILSQLTGIGFSNYNIKKILPKLIMVVVLVNLSYFLCQLAVDISNILGVQLHDQLSVWADKAVKSGNGGKFGFQSVLSSGMSLLFGGAGVAGLVVTFPFWLPTFLLVLISCFFSVLFFFAVLATRNVAVIVLIVLAPAAIICYALPNTQSIFKRWKSAFTSVLVVFPVCGALIGGGKFASAVLLSTGAENNEDFVFMLMAMLVQVVPFFMIPSLLRKSLSAIGNIGAKMQTMGGKLGGFTKKQVANTDRFKDMQRNLMRGRDTRLGKKLSTPGQKVREIEDDLHGRGVDLNDNAAVRRALGGKDYRTYKDLKRKAENPYRKRRLAQAGRRLERMAMEDIEAEVASTGELMTPDSEKYQRMLTSRRSRQTSAESAALESIYASGEGKSIIEGRDKVDATDMKSLAEELGAVIERLNKDPKDNDAMARMQALTTIMAKSGEGGENALRNVLLDQVHNNVVAADNGNTSALEASNNTGLRAVSDFMIDKFGGQFKSHDRDTFDLANTLKSSNAYQAKKDDGSDNGDYIGNIFKIDRNPDGTYRKDKETGKTAFKPNKFDYNSANKMSEETLAGANDDQLDRIYSAIQTGDLSGQQLQNFISLTDRTLNGDTKLKVGVRGKLERMQMAAYAQNSNARQQLDAGQTLQRTQVNANSADILAKAENKSLENMVSQIKTTDFSDTKVFDSPDKVTAKVDEMRGIAANAKYALENYNLPTAKAELLQEIISSVQNHTGAQAENGGSVLTNYDGGTLTADSGQIKLRDAKPAPQKIERPSNWIRTPNSPHGYQVINRQNGQIRNLNTREIQWLQDARSHNNQIDFQNQTTPPDPNNPNGQNGQNGPNNPNGPDYL